MCLLLALPQGSSWFPSVSPSLTISSEHWYQTGRFTMRACHLAISWTRFSVQTSWFSFVVPHLLDVIRSGYQWFCIDDYVANDAVLLMSPKIFKILGDTPLTLHTKHSKFSVKWHFDLCNLQSGIVCNAVWSVVRIHINTPAVSRYNSPILSLPW